MRCLTIVYSLHSLCQSQGSEFSLNIRSFSEFSVNNHFYRVNFHLFKVNYRTSEAPVVDNELIHS